MITRLGLRLAAWRAERDQAMSEAAALLRDHGDQAYAIAVRMAAAERSGKLVSPSLPPGHWSRVRRAVKRAGQTRRAIAGAPVAA